MAKEAVIKARLTLNGSQFAAGLKKASGLASGFAKKVGGLLTSPLAAVGAGLGGLFAVGAFAEGIKGALDLGGEMSDLSARTGEGIDKLMVFQQVLKDNGVEAGDAGKILNKMGKAISEAADGSGEAAAGLDLINLKASDLLALSPVEQFQKIGAAIDGIANPARRGAAAMKIFGKSGGQLLAVFADKEGFATAARSIGRQAQLLKQNAEIFDRISDRLGRAGLKLQGFYVGVASTLAPTLDALTKKLDGMDFSKQGEKFGAGIKVAAEYFAGVFSDPGTLLSAFNKALEAGMLSALDVLANGIQYAVEVGFSEATKKLTQGITGLLTGGLSSFAAKGAPTNGEKPAMGTTDFFGAKAAWDQVGTLTAKLRELGKTALDTGDDAKKSTDKLTGAWRSLDTSHDGLRGASMALGANAFAQLWSQNRVMNVADMGTAKGHALFSARDRKRFIDDAVAAGDRRPASSAGAYGAIRSGDHRRALEYERSKALKKETLETTNATLADSLKEQQRMNATLESYNRP